MFNKSLCFFFHICLMFFALFRIFSFCFCIFSNFCPPVAPRTLHRLPAPPQRAQEYHNPFGIPSLWRCVVWMMFLDQRLIDVSSMLHFRQFLRYLGEGVRAGFNRYTCYVDFSFKNKFRCCINSDNTLFHRLRCGYLFFLLILPNIQMLTLITC